MFTIGQTDFCSQVDLAGTKRCSLGLWQPQTLRLRCTNSSSLPGKSLVGGGGARASFAGVVRPVPDPQPSAIQALWSSESKLLHLEGPRAPLIHSPHQGVLWEATDAAFCPIPKKPRRMDRGDPGGRNTGTGEAISVQKHRGTAALPAIAKLGTKADVDDPDHHL